MEALYEIFSVVIGQYILGTLGRFIRKIISFVLRLFGKSEKKKSKSDFDGIIDVERYKDKIAGLVFLIAIMLIYSLYIFL